MKSEKKALCTLLTGFLIIVVLILMEVYAFSALKVFATSPTFVRQEIIDNSSDWYYYDIQNNGLHKKWFSPDAIKKTSGLHLEDISSVTYVSDGKRLNVTFWLTNHTFEDNPMNHTPIYHMDLNVDPDKDTGFKGIDYDAKVAWDSTSHTWKSFLLEYSKNGNAKVMNTKVPFSLDKFGGSITLSLDLGAINYPSQYLLTFSLEDALINGNVLWDFTNSANIPPPDYSIIPTYQSPLILSQGDKKTLGLEIKSLNLQSRLQPIVNFTYIKSNETKDVNITFDPSHLSIPLTQPTSIFLSMNISTNAQPVTYILPIKAVMSFPPQYLGNPTESIIKYFNLTLSVKEPTPLSEQLGNWLTQWFNPVTGVYTTISTIINGILGWRLLIRRKNTSTTTTSQ